MYSPPLLLFAFLTVHIRVVDFIIKKKFLFLLNNDRLILIYIILDIFPTHTKIKTNKIIPNRKTFSLFVFCLFVIFPKK